MKVWALTVNLGGAPLPHQNLIHLSKKKPSRSQLQSALESISPDWELPPLENIHTTVDSLYRFGGWPQTAVGDEITYYLRQWKLR